MIAERLPVRVAPTVEVRKQTTCLAFKKARDRDSVNGDFNLHFYGMDVRSIKFTRQWAQAC